MTRRAPLRTTRIELRCTPDERQRWEDLARARGCSLSVLIRLALNKPQTKMPDADPALLRQIGAIGNNVNQLTRWVNTYKSDADSRQVVAELEVIHGEIAKLTRGKLC